MYTKQDIRSQIKPLSDNVFAAFWQRLWQRWLGVWAGYSARKPKAAKLIKEFVVMYLFSNLVTIWQALIMIFLPYAFKAIWDVPFVWPALPLPWDGLNYAIFNEPVKFLLGDTVQLASTAAEVAELKALGGRLQMAGLGNFLAFEIAVFTAQCINFPLQRNVTFKSKGNPVRQAVWYFIGWVGISVGVNAIWGICNPLMLHWNWNDTIIALLKTFLTGGVSMLVFFPIFKLIFPDIPKQAEAQRVLLEKRRAAGDGEAALAELSARVQQLEHQAEGIRLENELHGAESLANVGAIEYFALEKAAAEATGAERDAAQKRLDESYESICARIDAKKAAQAAWERYCAGEETA